ncbi:MAG TPA: hypothetical protein PLM09_08805 [Casimicrobiaceae bacterium]|nr:hypothetical protein [Casimicrobiaceae bacterium]
MPYERTQFGILMAVGTLLGFAAAGLALAFIVSPATRQAVAWLPWALYGVLAGGFLLVGWMRVRVDAVTVRAVMGIGLLRKTVEIADIRRAEVVRTRVWWGWGVHLTPAGWLYNVGGRRAVRLELASERAVMIGSADPEGLHDAIEAARTAANRPR